ncbi:MAG TPA: carbohydrate porin [Kofleriaceae bacterium]|jgi:hypothetical protein
MRLALVVLLLAGGVARAQPAESAERADDAFDVMNLLSRRGLHDLNDEWWNVYGQVTWIEQGKLPFHAAYTNFGGSTSSLSTAYENSFTGSFTIFSGLRLWPGAELYFAPEAISEQPLSNLHGLGGVIQNFELQKGGTPTPTVYYSRLYVQQTLGFGGERQTVTSNPGALGKHQDARRVVVSFGRFSVLDFFDKNSYASDLRREDFDMAFMTYAAYDFVADTRGYTWGAVAELYFDDWSARFMRAAPPKHPNQTELDFRFWDAYGDQLELEHDHVIAGQPGAVRVLGYHNHETMGNFTDAILAFQADPTRSAAGCEAAGLIHYSSTNPNAPDLCWVRKPNDKYGIGINIEQAIAKDLGVFMRAMYADGQTEVYAFTPTDRSFSIGALARGARWCRRKDYAGVAFAANGISQEHVNYLKLGGIDGFIGDGKLNPGTETVTEAFYGANLTSSIWLSGDYEFIVHPAFNADRGPVHVFGARLHAEF